MSDTSERTSNLEKRIEHLERLVEEATNNGDQVLIHAYKDLRTFGYGERESKRILVKEFGFIYSQNRILKTIELGGYI